LNRQEKLLCKIAVAIGAMIGLSHLMYLIFVVFGFQIAIIISWLLFLIQQCVIMAIFFAQRR